MKVTIVNGTENPEELLIFTKNTRLNMAASNMRHVKAMPPAMKKAELEYMVNTIRSSWEFVDYTIMIEGVTRAFTHQLVRNRHGSYAQQTMRILDVAGFEYLIGPSLDVNQEMLELYCDTMTTINDAYNEMIANGVEIEDARGILPTNIKTNIVAKFNLRTLSELVSARSSSRTQGEYKDFIDALYKALVAYNPWIEMFLNPVKHQAAQALQEYVDGNCVGQDRIDLLKKIDLLRK